MLCYGIVLMSHFVYDVAKSTLTVRYGGQMKAKSLNICRNDNKNAIWVELVI